MWSKSFDKCGLEFYWVRWIKTLLQKAIIGLWVSLLYPLKIGICKALTRLSSKFFKGLLIEYTGSLLSSSFIDDFHLYYRDLIWSLALNYDITEGLPYGFLEPLRWLEFKLEAVLHIRYKSKE